MYEVYRVVKQFQWNGFVYGPEGTCGCDCSEIKCTNTHGTGCVYCQRNPCKCGCTVNEYNYAGNIWIVNAGHPRKDMIIRSRLVIGDATLPSIDKLMAQEKYTKLLKPIENILQEQKGRPNKVAV